MQEFVEVIFRSERTGYFLNSKDGLLEDNGFMVVNQKGETKIPGIFAAGDILWKNFKQITTATSDGTIASLSAKEYISKKF